MPIGRGISSVTKSNWEGVGVKPDIAASKENALVVEHIVALKKLIVNCTDSKLKKHLKDILEKIQSTVR